MSDGASDVDDPTAFAAIPVVRDCIVQEYADGDLCVRIKIDAADVDAFWRAFPDTDEAVFLCDGGGAIEAVRGPLIREYADGGLAVRLLISPGAKREFRRLWPRPGATAVLARENPESARQRLLDADQAPAPAFGHLAQALRLSPQFLLNPKVWNAVGTDEDYLGYIRARKCANCGWVPHDEMGSFVSCEAAHVRRVAGGAGTSIKPRYSAIPLCPKRGGVEGCHAAQHRIGESFLGGKEAVDKLRIRYVQSWVWDSLKAQLGYEHWNEVPPETLIAWADEHGLADCVPDVYFEALEAA